MDNQNLDWHCRGCLPHYDSAQKIQIVSFRLHDSVPLEALRAWKSQLRWHKALPANHPAAIKLRVQIHRYEDKGRGSCWLGMPAIATLVENALQFFNHERYRLYSWCVMPNHVHMLMTPFKGFPLHATMRSLKGYTAREANRSLNRSGTFWMRDYHDRCIRDQGHFVDAVEYIEMNPVKAGLVSRPEQWRYSSAPVRLERVPDAGIGLGTDRCCQNAD